MNTLANLKLGYKLLFGIVVLIAFSVVIGVTGYLSSKKINAILADNFERRMPGITFLLEADRDLYQLLVAERSMMFTDTGSDAFRQLVDDYNENLAQAVERINNYANFAINTEENKIIEQLRRDFNTWEPLSKRIVTGRMDSTITRDEAIDMTMGNAAVSFERMRENINQLTEFLENQSAVDFEAAKSTFSFLTWTIVVIILIGVFTGILIALFLNAAITKPLTSVIEKLTTSSDEVASASRQISNTSQSLAEGASEQASSLEETSSSLEEISSMAKHNAENSGEAKQLVAKAKTIVENVDKRLGEMVEAIGQITKSSEETGKIIKTIDEIAFQTNLLALNAAVEAARAGEAGAGFAVVAGEVRNLAMRAAEAAKNTSSLIQSTIEAVGNGNRITGLTRDAYKENEEISEKIGLLVDEIAAASAEQSQGLEQINIAVSQMGQVTQSSAASAEESSSASSELTQQAELLNELVFEITRIVEGDDAHDTTRLGGNRAIGTRTSTGKMLAKPLISRSGTKTNRVKAVTKLVKPNDIIPLDDNDVAEF